MDWLPALSSRSDGLHPYVRRCYLVGRSYAYCLMETALLALVAAAASLLTFFSGFGLGTILLPVFLLFYPIDIAIVLTAIVHFLNGVFKTGLIGRKAQNQVLLHFGIPAFLCAFAGASLLVYLTQFALHIQFRFLGMGFSTNPVRAVIGLLLIVFAFMEIVPVSKSPRSGKGWLWTGGALSGFFGGLSGHQGALRSAFLIRLGLTKEQFIGTGIIISLLIDITRLPVYLRGFDSQQITQTWPVLLIVTLAAFGGAYAGNRLLKKITLRFVQYLVAAGVCVIGVLLALGII